MTQDLANSHETRTNAEVCEDFDNAVLVIPTQRFIPAFTALLCDGGFTSHICSTLAEPCQAAVLP